MDGRAAIVVVAMADNYSCTEHYVGDKVWHKLALPETAAEADDGEHEVAMARIPCHHSHVVLHHNRFWESSCCSC